MDRTDGDRSAPGGAGAGGPGGGGADARVGGDAGGPGDAAVEGAGPDPQSPPADMLWCGWGDPARATALPGPLVRMLRELLGVRPAQRPPVELKDIEPAGCRLSAAELASLAAAVGTEGTAGTAGAYVSTEDSAGPYVRTDAESRIRHMRGKSTPDLLRIRAGEAGDAPDAVVLPGDHDQVLTVLDVCARHGIAVVPFGGGTSVVGGLAPEGGRRFIALDLRRLDRLVSVDPVSRTAVLQPGLRAPRAERLLRAQGFTLGHFPQSFEWATIGGFAAARSSGQASAGYGRFDEMVVGLTVATPQGSLDLGRAPRSAAGPDLRQLVLGSEGAFGVITSVRVRIHPAPVASRYEGWRFPSFEVGAAALRALAQDGPVATVMRLSDETETMVGLARVSDPAARPEPGTAAADPPPEGGCLAIIGFEGTGADVGDRHAKATAVLAAAGGEPLGTEPGESWEHGRFGAPYLRDSLLDIGAFAETLETATFWSGVPRLHQAVRDALATELTAQGLTPLVMCHISHTYATGASLYFTVVCAQGQPALESWDRAKRAANDAILAAGGTISHHHGVGTDHRDWYAQEIGPLAVEVLKAVKDRLDPAGILNPGVLLPTR